ncbi:MAG: MFS transporter [Ilumatobacteraceae bacterium]
MTEDIPEQDAARLQADRRALRSVAVQFFANGTVYATVIPRLPDIRERVDISIGALGLVLTIGSIAGLVGSLLTARVIASVGSRRVMIYGAVLSIGALPIIGFATSPVVLAAALMLLLFFDIFIDVAMNVQGSALSARRHTPVMNRLHGLWSLGSVAGGVLTVVLLRADVSTPVHLTVVACLLIGVLMFVAPGLLHRDETPELTDAVAALGSEPTGGTLVAGTLTDEGPMGRVPAGGAETPVAGRGRTRFGVVPMLLAIGGATAMTIEITNGDWASFRLGDDLAARPGIAGLGFLTFTTGMTIGRLGGDWVQVRVGTNNLFKLSALIAGMGSALAMLVPNVGVSVVGFLIAGLGTSILFPQLYDRAARAPGPPGSGFASMLIGQRGAGVLAPLIVGALADTTAFSVGQAMAVVVLPSAVIVYLTTLVRQPARRR